MSDEPSDLLSQLIADCRTSEDPESTLETLCTEHPDLASELREQVGASGTDGDSAGPADDVDTARLMGAAPRTAPLDRIGPYRILDTLGEGGMGTVYLAEQSEPVRRRVAMKVIKLGMDSKQIVRRFEHERQSLALMNHEGIAQVFDCGTSERGQPYFVMELVRGAPINTYCDLNRVSLEDRVKLVEQVCAAVQHAHQKGVIHRDLKPGNILVSDAEGRVQVKIIDFGLAKALNQGVSGDTLYTMTGAVLGTPEYMAPEQADPTNLDVDIRADVYSIGVLLYELLVGALPFSSKELRGASTADMQRLLREAPTPKPSTKLRTASTEPDSRASQLRTTAPQLRRALRNDLDWVVLKAMDKDRNRRYASMSALSDDLRRFRAREPLEAGPPSTAYRLKKLVQRHRARFVVAALLLLTLLAGAVGTIVQWQRAERAAAENLERAAAEAKARQSAEAALGFLEKVVRQASPDDDPIPDLKVRELFEALARSVEDDLADQPEVQSRLLCTVGMVQSNLGLRDEACEAWERCLEIREREGMPDDESIGTMLLFLGDSHLNPAIGPEKARAYLQRAISLYTRLERPDQVRTAHGTLNYLSVMAADAEKVSDDRMFAFIVSTLNQWLRNEETGERRDNGSPEDLDRTRAELLELMRNVELDWREGRREPAMQRLLAAYERTGILTEGSPDKIKKNVGYLLVAGDRFVDWSLHVGREDLAEAVLQLNLRLAEERFGPASKYVRNARFALAERLRAKGRLEEAEALYASALDELGAEDEAGIYWMPLAARLLDVRLRLRPEADVDPRLLLVPGPPDRDVPGSIGRLRDGRIAYIRSIVASLDRAGRSEQAMDVARRALGEPDPKAKRPLEHALLRADLGALLTERGEFEAAEVQLLAAHGRLEKRRSKVEEEDWAQVIDRLVDLHERWGRPDEARTWEGRR